jgi:hypothetical protein
MEVPSVMSQIDPELLRRPQSAGMSAHKHTTHSHSVRSLSPLRAPALMLVNGLGEARSLPSPVVGGHSDDDSWTSDDETTPPQHNHSKSLSVPSLFDSPVKMNGRRQGYSPSMSPTKPPLSPPKRSLSPPKMIFPSADGKPRPVSLFRIVDVESSERTSP